MLKQIFRFFSIIFEPNSDSGIFKLYKFAIKLKDESKLNKNKHPFKTFSRLLLVSIALIIIIITSILTYFAYIESNSTVDVIVKYGVRDINTIINTYPD